MQAELCHHARRQMHNLNACTPPPDPPRSQPTARCSSALTASPRSCAPAPRCPSPINDERVDLGRDAASIVALTPDPTQAIGGAAPRVLSPGRSTGSSESAMWSWQGRMNYTSPVLTSKLQGFKI
ncbi:hypothetical protein GSI_01709 [Ganoderma sinense ZZ0214-1]|uniref:Uncharacterized protein n=1 Tax=Ganoderma sinense ZZ0214-1 TaxID=1077348 RepID=A0A2G8SQK6_9APHY|nr:hypothetical protein GSI_01709 [Ganoderma sinense ZZ0214-1]